MRSSAGGSVASKAKLILLITTGVTPGMLYGIMSILAVL